MKKILFLFVVLLISAAATFTQSVTITENKVTYTRKKPIADYKKTFTITYPKVKASSPAVAKKIESALSYQKVLGINVREELTDIQWLETAEFTVDYNDNGLLSVSLFMEGSGAYPSGRTEHVVIDSKTGTRITSALAFHKTAGLLAIIRKDMEKEVAAAIKEAKADKENADLDVEDLFKMAADYSNLSLKEFSVNEKGVTFYHDYGFPHAVQALQPNGEFTYLWADLRPYIKPAGLLGRMTR